MEQKTGFREAFLRLVAIVGLVAILILGAWGIILLAFNMASIFTGAGSAIGSLFNRNAETPAVVVHNPATTTTPIVVVPQVVQPTSTQPTIIYTPATPRATLYGLPDLSVRITSINSLSSVQGRVVVQFVIENTGTNVARSGWNFSAQLPLNPVYTYQSVPQQALNPGDKIAYTMSFDGYMGSYSNNPYNYYTQPTTCYTYNGYSNVAGPCVNYDEYGNVMYNQNYNYNTTYYNNTYNYQYQGGTVTIIVDPANWIAESAEYNNSASKNVY